MFDFEKLEAYKKAKAFNSHVRKFICEKKLDKITENQLARASFSIVLNIAEGTGRYTNKDKRNFYAIARSSAFECVAIFDVLKDESICSEEEFKEFYLLAEEISKMLFAMIRHLEKQY
jgi:four helix bundle protein